MTSRSSSALRKSTAQRKSAVTKAAGKSRTGKSKTGKLPEWNLSDLYSGIDAPEVIHGGAQEKFARRPVAKPVSN